MKQVDISPSSPASTCKAWGAFLSPPIFVGTPLDMDALKQQNNICRAFVKALDTVYKGRQVVVSREGLVVLAEAQRATAVGLLNEIMAVLILRSVSVNGIRETDLVECYIDTVNKEIDSERWSYKAGNQALPERRFEGWDARFYHPDNIRSFMRRAELMTGHPTVRKDLRLLLEAYTSHQESAFTTSLLLSWLGIVRLLEAKWRPLAEQRQGDNGVENATSDPSWNAGRLIEDLRLCNAINDSVYQEAKKLYEKHSNLIRSDEETTFGESESCFHFFLSQLRKTLTSE